MTISPITIYNSPRAYGMRLGGVEIMGTLFSALDIARSGMSVAQFQLDVTAHNIANINTPGFSRQRAELTSRGTIERSFGQIGRGVGVSGVTQSRDVFLDTLFRSQSPSLASSEIQAGYYARIEDIFIEPNGDSLSVRLNQFFNSLNDFATNVEELPVRQGVINEAQALGDVVHQMSDRFNLLRTNANAEVQGIVPQVNSLSDRIARLNDQIRRTEAGGSTANDLRDDRAVLLDELSSLVNITTRERSNGVVDVLVSGDTLVDGAHARALEAVRNPNLDPVRNDLFEVRFADSGTPLTVSGGELFGALEIRDKVVPGISADLDEIVNTLIFEVNRVHSQGNGIENHTGPLISTNAVSDPGAPLALPFPVLDGSFDVERFDSNGASLGIATVNIVAGVTSLNDIATQLGGVNASVTSDGRLQLTAAPGESFVFANDTSGALAALGVNTFLTGTNAETFGVNADIAASPELLSSAFATDPTQTGDNSAALALADLESALLLNGGSSSLSDSYESLVAGIGVNARSASQSVEVERTFTQGIQARRTQVSGVDLNEETINLILFQRAFEASARVVVVADSMLETLISLIR